MVSAFSTNIQLEEPAFGDYAGTWDTPVNANFTLLDLAYGGVTSIALAGANVTLTSSEFQQRQITFSSTLTASVTITFPTSFRKSYEINHACTGSTTFTITLKTTAAGGQVICVPPGEITDVINDGVNFTFKGLHRIGKYWDHAGSSVPNWVSGCTVPPYLNCDGTKFSSATYPQLTLRLGSTTLPDSRGRVRAALNQGTGRMTTAGSGVDGNTIISAGGSETITLIANEVPTITGSQAHTMGTTFADIVNSPAGVQNETTTGAGVSVLSGLTGLVAQLSFTNAANVTSNNTGSGAHINVQPCYVGGICMIRAG